MASILFVCTGNICRSPSAEAILRHKIQDRGHVIDSAGTHDYHVGREPDKRALRLLEQANISTSGMLARKVDRIDFEKFDYVIAMDRGHYDILNNIKPEETKSSVILFSDFCNIFKSKDVPDPYYDGQEEFEVMMDIVKDGVDGMIKELSL